MVTRELARHVCYRLTPGEETFLIVTLLPNKNKFNPGDHFLHLLLPQQYATLTASTYKLPESKFLAVQDSSIGDIVSQ